MIPYSIWVLCHNMWDTLTERFLRTFFEYIDRDIEFEFLFVDNGSTDGTMNNATHLIPELIVPNCVSVRYVRLEFGSSEAFMQKTKNIVVPMCRGERIIHFNNDISFCKTGWLKVIDSECFIPSGGQEVGQVGREAMGKFGIEFIAGGWDCIPRKLVGDMICARGMFSDVSFSMVYEDVDFSAFVRKLGYKVRHVPQLTEHIQHGCHITLNEYIPYDEQVRRGSKDDALIEKRSLAGYYA